MRNDSKIAVNRPCAVCGRGEPDPPLYVLRFPDYRYPGDFVLRRCVGCGLLYNSPRLDENSLAALYDHNYYLFNEPEEAALERIAQLHTQTVGALASLVADRDVLEVGCAKGYLLALLKSLGWRVQGVELSSYAAGFAASRLGVDVYQGTIEGFAASHAGRRFPAVYTTDVIEHVSDPPGFLAALAQVMAPGGVLLISTPNADAEGIRMHGGDWLGFNPFHIWGFGRDTLSRLVEGAGFDVLKAYTYQNAMPQSRPRAGRAARIVKSVLPASARSWIRRLRERAAARPDAASLDERLRRTAARVREQAAFDETVDGRHPDARACRGENLVVIARRQGRGAAPSSTA